MEIDFKKIAKGYFQNKENLSKKVSQAAAEIKRFNYTPFHDYNLDEEGLKKFALKNVLYFFEAINCKQVSPQEICNQIQKLKDDPANKTKLPKVNLDTALLSVGNRTILYVGKSNGNFNTRLKQHLGKESKKTYALHLSEWQNDKVLSKVKLKLHYLSIDLAKYKLKNKIEENEFIEQLESILHSHFRPILGRTGH